MGEDRERNVYRIAVLVIAVLGGLALLWALANGSEIEIGQNLLDFLPDPTNGNGNGVEE